MTFTIDLNCDLGESFGAYTIGHDEEILKVISSANIACGFHAGDPTIMRQTVKLALENDVAIGAHPGLQDINGFGRRMMTLTPREVYDLTIYQIGALNGFVTAEGAKLQHVKPHGALYNMCAQDKHLAAAIAEAVYKVNPELILFGLANSELITAGKNIGLRTANEAFSDRTYQPNGLLTARSEENALITDEKVAIKQIIQMVTKGNVTAIDSSVIPLQAQTICIHGDGKSALTFAQRIPKALKVEGIDIRKVRSFL